MRKGDFPMAEALLGSGPSRITVTNRKRSLWKFLSLSWLTAPT